MPYKGCVRSAFCFFGFVSCKRCKIIDLNALHDTPTKYSGGTGIHSRSGPNRSTSMSERSLRNDVHPGAETHRSEAGNAPESSGSASEEKRSGTGIFRCVPVRFPVLARSLANSVQNKPEVNMDVVSERGILFGNKLKYAQSWQLTYLTPAFTYQNWVGRSYDERLLVRVYSPTIGRHIPRTTTPITRN
jgi:hypothetical protein